MLCKQLSTPRDFFLGTLLPTIACLVMAVSCIGSEVHEVEPREVTIRALPQELTKSALAGTMLPDAYGLAVSATHNDGALHTTWFTDIPYGDAGNGTWTAETVKYWPLTGGLDLLAYGTVGLKTPASGIVPVATWGSAGNVAAGFSLSVAAMDGTFDDLLYGAANGCTYSLLGTPMMLNHACVAVVLVFKSDELPYSGANLAANKGFTITGVTVNGVKTAGTFSFTNGGVAGGSSPDVAAWTALSGGAHSIGARVFGGTDGNPSESAVTALAVTRTAAVDLDVNPFGDAYVIIPVQGTYGGLTYGKGTSFTITYTMHNGAAGDVAGITYTFDCSSHDWAMGTKVVYTVTMAADQVSVTSSATAWDTFEDAWIYATGAFSPWGRNEMTISVN